MTHPYKVGTLYEHFALLFFGGNMSAPTISHQTITEASVPSRLNVGQKITVVSTLGTEHELHVQHLNPACTEIGGTIAVNQRSEKVKLLRQTAKGNWMLQPLRGDERQHSLAV